MCEADVETAVSLSCRALTFASFITSYLLVVDAADASLQVGQMWQQGPGGIYCYRIRLQDLLHSILPLRDGSAGWWKEQELLIRKIKERKKTEKWNFSFINTKEN